MSEQIYQIKDPIYPSHETCTVEISSKNWQVNLKQFRNIIIAQYVKKINVILDFRIVKRVIDRIGQLKRGRFPQLEFILFTITHKFKSENKEQIDFNELNRIGQSLEKLSKTIDLRLSVVHPFHQYTIPVKQIRFQREEQPINTAYSTKYRNYLRRGKEITEEFQIILKNIKQKITLPLNLSEENMISFSTTEAMINQLFSINKFVIQNSQKFFPILSVDSINIGEIDLSQDISASFIVFLDQFLQQLDCIKIKSLSFKAKQSLKNMSLLGEYLFIFSKFLSRCSELAQIQIIIDFNNAELSKFSNMFRHLVLNSLSSKICFKLQIIDISFSNTGLSNKQLLQELELGQFLSNRVDRVKQLNIRFYSASAEKNAKSKYNLLSQTQTYLNFYIQASRFGVEEYQNSSILRHLKFEFKGIRESRSFVKNMLNFNQVLLYGNSKETIEMISKSCRKDQINNKQDGNSVVSIDLLQIITEKDVDELWTVLINELFINCKVSLQNITCNIKFDEKLQQNSQNGSSIQNLRGDSLGVLKTQQRRPFELMIINFLQEINYKQLKRVDIQNTIYDVTFNKLLLKSISASKLNYLNIFDTITIDEDNSKFMIKLTNQTSDFLEMVPSLNYSQVQCYVSTYTEDTQSQLKQIINKTDGSIQVLELNIENKVNSLFLESLLFLLKKIKNLKISNKQYFIEISYDKVVYKQHQIDQDLLRQLNDLYKKYLHLHIDYYQDDSVQADCFGNFKYVNFYINSLQMSIIDRNGPKTLIENAKNIHKIVLLGLSKLPLDTMKNIVIMLKELDSSKIIDLFLEKKKKRFFLSYSISKTIKIIQYLKVFNQKVRFRQEIISTLLHDYLI